MSADAASSLPTQAERAAMREKYRMERDKRRRADGNDQYIEVTGEFSDYVDDPYLDSVVERDALTDEVDVIVIGGGFGGLFERGTAP